MDTNQTNFVVVKHNDIIEAKYQLSIFEERILLICIAQIDSMSKLPINHKFEVSVSDVADLLDTKDKGSIYTNLNAAVGRLFQRVLVIDSPSEDIKQSQIRWLSRIDYLNKKGVIRLTFSPEIIPYLSELNRDFTKYKLGDVFNFKSVYSTRIYEILTMRQGREKEKEINLDWLKERLQVEDKYSRMDNFKKNVIDIAVKEINRDSDMKVAYEPVKKGRSIVAFKFIYTITKPQKKTTVQQQQHSIFLTPPDAPKSKKQASPSHVAEYGPKGEFLWGLRRADVERGARVGEGYEQAAKRIVEERKKAKSNAV
jgi:plasmid replication initiation protein